MDLKYKITKSGVRKIITMVEQLHPESRGTHQYLYFCYNPSRGRIIEENSRTVIEVEQKDTSAYKSGWIRADAVMPDIKRADMSGKLAVVTNKGNIKEARFYNDGDNISWIYDESPGEKVKYYKYPPENM